MRLLDALPANEQLPARTAEAVETLAAALLPPSLEPTWDATLDPARHALAGGGRVEVAPDGTRTTQPETFDEAAEWYRRRIEEGWEAEEKVPHERLDFLDPGLTAISQSRAGLLVTLLSELEKRVRPGQIVEGPIQASDSYRKFIAQIRQDLRNRAGGGAGPRSWDHDPSA